MARALHRWSEGTSGGHSMRDESRPLSLAGQTIRWTFDGGPTAGKTYEHRFAPDGTVTWREMGGEKQSEPGFKESDVSYASFEVGSNVHLVSYLSGSGYALTVALNFETQRCFAVASNEKDWYPVAGTFEAIE